MSEFESAMAELLGKDAFFSTDFNVTDNVKKLAYAVNYLHIQIGVCQQMMSSEEDKSYVDDVKKHVIDILKNLK